MMTPGRRLATAPLLVAALMLALSPPARADSKREQAKAAVEQAERQYKLGRFEAALEDYTRAYELVAAPALLFNLGQCHKQLKNHERAIFFFEGYLRDEPRPTNRRLAKELIAESEAELARQASAPAVAPEPPRAAIPAPGPAVPVAAPPAPVAASPISAPPLTSPLAGPVAEPRRSGRSWWLWGAIAVGVVAAGALAFYETGADRLTTPGGTLGTIDRR